MHNPNMMLSAHDVAMGEGKQTCFGPNCDNPTPDFPSMDFPNPYNQIAVIQAEIKEHEKLSESAMEYLADSEYSRY